MNQTRRLLKVDVKHPRGDSTELDIDVFPDTGGCGAGALGYLNMFTDSVHLQAWWRRMAEYRDIYGPLGTEEGHKRPVVKLKVEANQ